MKNGQFLLKVWKIDKFRQIWKMFFPRIKWNIENFGKISWNLCKVEKFGKKCDKLQILLKVWKVANFEKFEEIFYRVKWKIENFGKISWNLWEVENFGKKCKKWSILLKVWKIDKFRQIWKNIFSTRKMKILEKSAGICLKNLWKNHLEFCVWKWKNLVKNIFSTCDKLQILLKVWKVAKFWKIWKNILPTREMKNWKFWKNLLKFVGSEKLW